jgi:hypothetical protein
MPTTDTMVPSYLALATDDMLFLSSTRSPFLQLKSDLEQLFDLTVCEGSIDKFLNLHFVQSPAGISFDQTQHIWSIVLTEYFKDVDPASIKLQLFPFPFPFTPSFERDLYEAAPLVGIDLTNATKHFGFSFGHIVVGLMHLSTISRPDLAYSVMHYSGYIACPNLPIFEALHLTMCYLFHHPHLPIMYSSKRKSTLQTHWTRGFADFLPGDYGDGLATFTDADHARCLRSRHLVSSHFQLLNGVLVSWGCKKQPTTSLHSTGAELHSILWAGFKNDTIQRFLGSIGLSFKSPSVIFEDNQGTIKLLCTHCLTDTVRHHDVKLAWLNEHFLHGTFIVAYLNTKLMLVDCITKPVNGVQLHLQISYCVGKRFYPASSTQHYVDLELHNYSWCYRLLKRTKPSS